MNKSTEILPCQKCGGAADAWVDAIVGQFAYAMCACGEAESVDAGAGRCGLKRVVRQWNARQRALIG